MGEEALSLRRDYVEGKISLTAPAIMPFEALGAISKGDIEAKILGAFILSWSLLKHVCSPF